MIIGNYDTCFDIKTLIMPTNPPRRKFQSIKIHVFTKIYVKIKLKEKMI
jgi:hypothetical protein